MEQRLNSGTIDRRNWLGLGQRHGQGQEQGKVTIPTPTYVRCLVPTSEISLTAGWRR